jgi:DNA primase
MVDRAKPQSELMDKQSILTLVLNSYHQIYLDNGKGSIFLKQHSLIKSHYWKESEVGICNPKLANVIPSIKTKQGKHIREVMHKSGLTADDGRQVCLGSIVFPLKENGVIKGLYSHRLARQSDLKPHTVISQTLNFTDSLYMMNQHRFNYADVVLIFDNFMEAFIFEQFGWVTTVWNGDDDLLEHLTSFDLKRIVWMTTEVNPEQQVIKLFTSFEDKPVSVWQCRLVDNWKSQVKDNTKPELLIEQWVQTSQSLKGEGQLDTQSVKPKSVEVKPVEPELQLKEKDLWLNFDDRHYRIRGIEKNHHHEQLKINLLVQTEEGFFVDSIELYSATLRAKFSKMACIDCMIDERVIRKDLGVLLLKLESYQAIRLEEKEKTKVTPMTEEDKRIALDWLHQENLIDALKVDLQNSNIVGEQINSCISYLACVSRLLPKPIAVLIQSTSSAGKSSLMDGVLRLMPDESQFAVSALTSQSLYYMGNQSLKHKILSVSEEEGMGNALYSMKVLQSQGSITIASTSRDKHTGEMQTQSHKVDGPIMLFLTTTAINIDEELANRCLVLTVNESSEQTDNIHELQRFRRTLEGWKSEQVTNDVTQKHHNVQRLLKPLKVINPFAESLSFINHQTRNRRDNEKYLTLIETITLLHQYQRPLKKIKINGKMEKYIEVTEDDIAMANQLAVHIFKRTLDELPPQTRKLLTLIEGYVEKESQVQGKPKAGVTFTRRLIREHSRWGNTQVHIHCQRLEQMEYLMVNRGNSIKGKSYSLATDIQQAYTEQLNQVFNQQLATK